MKDMPPSFITALDRAFAEPFCPRRQRFAFRPFLTAQKHVKLVAQDCTKSAYRRRGLANAKTRRRNLWQKS